MGNQIEKILTQIEKSNYPNIYFDEYDQSEKHDNTYWSAGVDEETGNTIVIYYNATENYSWVEVELN